MTYFDNSLVSTVNHHKS